MKKRRNRQNGYWHIAGLLSYFLVYMVGFAYLENRKGSIHMIHTALDDDIPFCEYFIIPYVLWYGFVAVTVIYFAVSFQRRKEYNQLASTLCIGATVFLLVSFLYPNGHNLRPELAEGGICVQLVRLLYQVDTPTNVLPSLHVFNAAACCIAILKSKGMQEKRGIRAAVVFLTIMIILSTMFLKQHSVIDVVLALLMNVLCYQLVYWVPGRSYQKQGKRKISLHG